MSEPGYLNYNGKVLRADKLLISPNNRSFRYGDGCFETIRMIRGKIIIEDYHFERLFASIERLQFEKPAFLTAHYLRGQLIELAKKNYHDKLARVRLMVFRGDGGLYDPENHFPNYLIQTWALNPANNELNKNGLVIDIYKDARKVCDQFSHIKNNNFLSYAMAALWAKKYKLNDALLLNPYGNIADATIANVFIVKDGMVKTPAISDGPVAGNMRRHLLKCMREENLPVEETQITAEDVLQASEIFLTNAIYGIRWVKQVQESNYQNRLAESFHKKFIEPLFV